MGYSAKENYSLLLKMELCNPVIEIGIPIRYRDDRKGCAKLKAEIDAKTIWDNLTWMCKLKKISLQNHKTQLYSDNEGHCSHWLYFSLGLCEFIELREIFHDLFKGKVKRAVPGKLEFKSYHVYYDYVAMFYLKNQKPALYKKLFPSIGRRCLKKVSYNFFQQSEKNTPRDIIGIDVGYCMLI